jgi:DNA-binding MarR family transcriptional regulator
VDIDDVRTFVAVAEAGSLSRAAAELHLTQPAVTRRLQRLEGAVGPLLDRRRRPSSLTPIGRDALERCRRLLSIAGELKALAVDPQVPSGEVRIGVAHALTELAFSQPVDEVRRAFPRVLLRLRTGWSRELLERVKTEPWTRPRSSSGGRGPAERPGRNGRENAWRSAGRRSRTRPREIATREAGWVLNPQAARPARRSSDSRSSETAPAGER